jgi:hypothetical protein
MLLERKTIELADDVLMDVIPDSEYVNLRVGKENKKVRKSDLYSVCYLIADAVTQDGLTAIKQTEVQHFTRLHRIKLKHNMREGDVVTTRCHISVPVAVVEGLKHIVDRKKTVHTMGGLPIIGAK